MKIEKNKGEKNLFDDGNHLLNVTLYHHLVITIFFTSTLNMLRLIITLFIIIFSITTSICRLPPLKINLLIRSLNLIHFFAFSQSHFQPQIVFLYVPTSLRVILSYLLYLLHVYYL